MINFKTQVVVDFGSVYINSNHSKMFEVKNSDSISQIFKTERYSERPKLDCGFRMTPSVSPAVKPGGSFKFKVEFSPKVPNFNCSDYFIVEHLYGNHCTIFTKATVKGSECSLSCRQIQMICSSEKKKAVKKFEIRNNGGCTVRFQFTIDNSNSCVKLEPYQGSIQPSKNLYITVTYTPTSHISYFKRIFCLVTYHDPISLDIYGMWSKKDSSIVNFDNIPVHSNSYQSFMNNVMCIGKRDELPLISLDKYVFDFGCCVPKRQTQLSFSVTNNYNTKLTVIWNRAVKEVFKIEPIHTELDVNSSVQFAALFKPSVKDMLYGAYLEAQLYTKCSNTQSQSPNLDAVLPFPIEINLKGHTFDEMSCGWAAQYRVEPLRLLLPPCTAQPFQSSHSTLTIHKLGHLPLAFKFHQPTLTSFQVKPEQGLIQEDFQIVVVQFNPKELNEAVYTEKWMLCFNSNESVYQCTVEFAATVETPQIVFNGGQEILFPSVHPGTPAELLVDLFNPTRLFFQYNLEILKGDLVLIVEKEGEIWPHEHKQVPWRFHPMGQGKLEALVSCTPLLNNVETKPTTATVRAVCEETHLKVIPSKVVFIHVMRDCQHERSFQVINNGDAIIRGEFTWDYLSCEDNNNGSVDLRLEPPLFTLEPGASINVSVYMTPLRKGEINIMIGHSQNGLSSTPLITVTVDCVFPCLQVTDLRHNNTGPLFSKLHFWKLLQIRTLNEVLQNVTLGENRSVHMNLPSYLCTTKPITIELLLENKSSVGVKFTLTQKAACDCKPVLTVVSFSRSKFLDLCPHKDQVQITPISANIKSDDTLILNIQISYTTVGNVEGQFIISIVPEDFEEINSSLELHITRTSIAENISLIDTTELKENNTFVFNMRPVFIGDYYPFVQGFVLYNNSNFSAHYDVDDRKLQGTPFKYIGHRNEISATSQHALIFTFLPHSCKTYEAEVILKINNTPEKLILRGTGINYVNEDSEVDDLMFPRHAKLMSMNPSPIYLSMSHLDIGPMKQCCTQRHVLFINNKTDDLISFKWHMNGCPDVLELRVHPATGAIHPQGMVECRLVSYCRGWPCHITLCVTCVFASFTKYSSMVQTIQKYREDTMKSSDYFVITESGSEVFELTAPAEEWPRKNYLTLSVTINVKHDSLEGINFLPISPSSIQLHFIKEPRELEGKHSLLRTFILERILWDVLNEKCNSPSAGSSVPSERYIQFKRISVQENVPVPLNVMQTMLEDILYSIWEDVLQITSRNMTEQLRRTLILQLKLQILSSSGACSRNSPDKTPTDQSIAETCSSRGLDKCRISDIQ
uniref:Abnormal spindle-like microcephaly-associated protein ASH domain-containing protein n=1 Tax=Cuerna arida TaxID=1464854 RepID=A0A1B6FET0_9HEMI